MNKTETTKETKEKQETTKKTETKPVEKKKEEQSKTTNTKEKKETKTPRKEKTNAKARGVALRISPKYAVAICKMIKGKTPEVAIDMLIEVTKEKRPVPMAALEVAHQKGKGIAGAKYPKNAATEIKRIVEQLRANAVVNGIENPIITLSKADRASAPFRTGGRKAKRAHILLEVQDRTKLTKKQN